MSVVEIKQITVNTHPIHPAKTVEKPFLLIVLFILFVLQHQQYTFICISLFRYTFKNAFRILSSDNMDGPQFLHSVLMSELGKVSGEAY